jgi:hypothetical protein
LIFHSYSGSICLAYLGSHQKLEHVIIVWGQAYFLFFSVFWQILNTFVYVLKDFTAYLLNHAPLFFLSLVSSNP